MHPANGQSTEGKNEKKHPTFSIFLDVQQNREEEKFANQKKEKQEKKH